MKTKIYKVQNGNEAVPPRLVRAANRSQAIRHCAKTFFSADLATQDDLVSLLGSVKVETADAEPAEPADIL